MPDAIHNKNEDYVYFTLYVDLKKTANNENMES